MPSHMSPRKAHAQSFPSEGDSSAVARIPWSSFPNLCAAFTPSPEEVLRRLVEKASEYKNGCTTGSAVERARARSIAAAYAETATLVKHLELLRLEASKNTQPAARNRDN